MRCQITATMLLLTFCIAGCSRDLKVRKQKYLESGERYFAKGEFAAASIQFRNALQVDPQFAVAHYQLGQAYLKLQAWNDAARELDAAVVLQPENDTARLDLANLLLSSGDLSRAQEHIGVLLVHQPQNANAHIAKGNLLVAQQQLSDAIRELQKAVDLDPRRGDVFLSLGVVQLRNNQPEAAEFSFRKAVALRPNSADAGIALAGLYQAERRYSEAEQQLLQTISSNLHDPNPRIGLARLYAAEAKKNEAEDLLRKSRTELKDNSVGYRMLGDWYFANGEIDNAMAEYADLNRLHPTDLQVTDNYVQLLIIKNRLAEARQLNEGVLKSRPGYVDALIERAQIQVAEGHASDAVSSLQKILQNDPNNALAYYHLGIAFDRGKETQLAQKAWLDAVRLRPDLMEAQRALAVAALRNGDMTELEQRARRMIELQPNSAEGYALLTICEVRRGRFSAAELDAKKAISVDPSSAAGYLQLGNLMFARGNYGKAELAYQQALDRESSSADALSGLMNTYFAENRPNRALAAARAQTVKVPGDNRFYDLLGTGLFDHRRSPQEVAEAEASFEKAVTLNEHDVDGWLKLIEVEAVARSANRAMETCRRALNQNPEEPGLYVLLGELFNAEQQWDEAKSAFQKALVLSPDNPAAANDLAYVMLQTGGNPDLAMPLAETARRGMPDSPQAADTMGWVLYQKGAYSSAIDQFRQALKLAEKAKSPDNPALHYHLGLAYERMGQAALARQQLRQVLKISPSYSHAEEIRKALEQLRG